MDKFCDQVRLLEQARILDRDRGLRAQYEQHRFICIGEFTLLLVHHLQHAHNLVLGDEWNAQQ